MSHRYNLRSSRKNNIPVEETAPVPLRAPDSAPACALAFAPASAPPPEPANLAAIDKAITDNWYWNFYESIGLRTDSTQEEIGKSIRRLLLMYHPDKRRGAEEVYERVSFIHFALGEKRDRYRDLLSSTYIPHGGGLLDRQAMEDYLQGKTADYYPAKLACVIPETGPRFTARTIRKGKAGSKKGTKTTKRKNKAWSIFVDEQIRRKKEEEEEEDSEFIIV